MGVNVQEGAPPEGPETRRRLAGLSARLAPEWLGARLGLIIVAVGLVVIGLGWNGTAGAGGEVNHVPVVQAQLPWLLSGGFLGLAIVVLGVGVLISRGYRQDWARLDARLQTLVEAVERLDGVGSGAEAASGVVVAGTDSYHTPACRLVAGRSEARYLTAEQAAAEGLTPCRVCHPPVVADQPR
jgi:hypothetical protein